ncbi:MAG: homoserine dehydrogenase [Chloroflexi bacterium]|nr:homoserine dehydrogenase [Chloroflexota bacterium]
MHPPVTPRSPLRVALLGLGSVARPVASKLVDPAWRADVETRGQCAPELRAVGVRDPARQRGLTLPDDVLVTDDLRALVRDPDIDVVVELIGGTTDAADLVHAAIAAGKHVVTGNKALLATQGPAIEAAARKAGVTLRFEAAVAGGIPILGPLTTDLAANRMHAVRGIVNGTTNHILSAMARDARTYADVLAEAQARGYAEADPSGDVDGHDAVHKLTLLTRLAFGVWTDPAALRRAAPRTHGDGAPGITGVTTADLGGAARLGMTIKLVARAERDQSGSVRAAVSPMAVRATSSLGSTDGVLNLIEVIGDPVGRVAFRGPGAGGAATSSSVLGALLAIAHGSGSTWEWLPAAHGPVPVLDDLAGEGGWYFVAPELMLGSLPQSIAEVVLAQDMEAFVVRSMTLQSIRARLAGLDIDATIYPVLSEA